MTIFEAQKRLSGFDLMESVVEILTMDRTILKELQHDQMKAGKRKDGGYIRPEYKSEKYARFKQLETPHPTRPPFTPNLYLTGRFYRSFYVNVNAQTIAFGSNDDVNKLEDRYSLIFGLNEETKAYYIDTYLKPKLKREFNDLFR